MATNHNDDVSTHWTNLAHANFSGFKWLGTPPEGAFRVRNEFFRDSMVNWSALNDLAASLRSTGCMMLESIGYGHSHMIRQIKFVDGVSWIARLAMPPFNFNENEKYLPKLDYWSRNDQLRMQSECDTMSFIKEKSTVPVPRIFHYSTTPANPTGVPFQLMECVFGNPAHNAIPSEYREKFHNQLAQYHVTTSPVLS